MAGKSDYLENKLLDLVLGAQAFSAPATLYIELYTAAPTDAGGGTPVSGNNYSRAAVTNNSTNWPAATSGVKTSGAAINFATPSGSWGTVSHFGIFDASSGGNLLYWGALISSVAISTGQSVSFASGTVTVTED